MNKKFYEVVVGLLFAAFSMVLVQKVLAGGFFNMLWLVGAIALTIFFSLMKYKQSWHGIALGLLAGATFSIPMYGLKAFSLSFLFSAFVVVALLGETLLSKRSDTRMVIKDPLDLAMLFLAGVSIVRFAYDRPGVVGFGAQSGGLSQALYIVLACVAYFAFKRLCHEVPLTRKQLWMIIPFGIILQLQAAFRSVYHGRRLWFHELADTAAWFLLPVLLVLNLSKYKKLNIRFWLISFIFLGLSVVADHRSRMFFIIAEILIIAFFYRKTAKVAFGLLFAGVLGVMALFVVGGGQLPNMVRRPLSMIMPSVVEMGMEDAYGSALLGWGDEWRLELYKMAWVEIKEHPLVGSGFGLDVREALSILAGSTDAAAQMEMLILSGSYHNTYIMLAADLGLPFAIVALCASVIIPLKLANRAFRHPDSVLRQFSVVLVTFWSGVFGMAMINGDKYQFYIICILLAYMSYLYQQMGRQDTLGTQFEIPTKTDEATAASS